MAVRIRMKQMGRTHRHYYRIVAIDHRQPRDGKVIEELGTYDPHVKEKSERVTLRPERIKYWQVGRGSREEGCRDRRPCGADCLRFSCGAGVPPAIALCALMC